MPACPALCRSQTLDKRCHEPAPLALRTLQIPMQLGGSTPPTASILAILCALRSYDLEMLKYWFIFRFTYTHAFKNTSFPGCGDQNVLFSTFPRINKCGRKKNGRATWCYTICFSPHGYQLLKPTWKICFSFHAERERTHPSSLSPLSLPLLPPFPPFRPILLFLPFLPSPFPDRHTLTT